MAPCISLRQRRRKRCPRGDTQLLLICVWRGSAKTTMARMPSKLGHEHSEAGQTLLIADIYRYDAETIRNAHARCQLTSQRAQSTKDWSSPTKRSRACGCKSQPNARSRTDEEPLCVARLASLRWSGYAKWRFANSSELRPWLRPHFRICALRRPSPR